MPLEAIKYICLSAVIVISLFMGIRLLFAHEMRREAWRSVTKRYIYMSRPRFKTVTLTIGWISLLLALYVAYFQILDLMTD